MFGTNMNTWVVAFLSLHGGEIKQMVVNADSKLEAYRQMLDIEFGKDYWREYISDTASEDDVEEYVYDCDCYISAIKIPTWTSR